MSEEEVRLVYFDIRGLAEPVRWMLELSGVKWMDDRIPLNAWETRKRSSVERLKEKRRSVEKKAGGRSKFVPQFPVLLIGDDFTITQPLTVMHYLARKYGFNGESAWEEARADEVADLVYDLRLQAVDFEGTAYNSSTPDIKRHTCFRDFRNSPDSPAKAKMRETLSTMWFPLYFQKFDALLQEAGGQYICGPNLTFGDLVVVNFLDIAEDLVDPNCLNEFPRLRDLKDRILSMPQIAEWKKKQAMQKLAVDEDEQ